MFCYRRVGAPGVMFEDVIARRTDLDMQAKMREDPLYAIRYVIDQNQSLDKLLPTTRRFSKKQESIQVGCLPPALVTATRC